MMTEAQLTAEIYGALESIVNLYWISQPSDADGNPITPPFAIYRPIDIANEYSFFPVSSNRVAEERIYQIDLYTSPEELLEMETLYDSIKTAMEGIGYRLTGSNPDFLDEASNLAVRVGRWEKWNV